MKTWTITELAKHAGYDYELDRVENGLIHGTWIVDGERRVSSETAQQFLESCGGDTFAELDPDGNVIEFETRREMENWHSCNDGVGLLYVCDRDGNNAEPIIVTDTPTTFDDYLAGLNANDGDGNTYRAATGADNLSARVDAIAVNADGEIVGYYKWTPAHYEITLTSGREATANTFAEALAILRAAIPQDCHHASVALVSGEEDDAEIWKAAGKTGDGMREWEIGLVWERKPDTWQHLAYVEERV